MKVPSHAKGATAHTGASRATPPALRPGHATAAGTSRYATRLGTRLAPDFYRSLGADGVRVSSIGLGTYLGECDGADDSRYLRSAQAALSSGINLLDTSINYRCQRSERTLGRALQQAIEDVVVSRDEVVVCTKGGYIPLDGTPPASRDGYQQYLRREYVDRGVLEPNEVVAGGHCLSPGFLSHQLDRSRVNLGLHTLDIYYLHNPEQQLDAITPAQLRDRLRTAFALLEERCARGELIRYGCATWNGLRVPPDVRGHLELGELVEVAKEAGGDGHHFGVVQAPISLAMPEAVRTPTQRLPGGRVVPLLVAAAELGVAVVASATLLQSKLASGMPPEVRDAIPGLETDAQRAVAFVRSLPVVTALVGMKRAAHVEENLVAGR